MKHLIILFACLFATQGLFAQGNHHFTTSGTIEFEKNVNVYALLKKRITKENEMFMQQFVDAFKKNNGQFKKFKSVLSFNKEKTMFVPTPEEGPGNSMLNDPAIQQNNTIATDVVAGTSVTQKKVFEELFLLKDTVRKINWKITDETRDIAGYTCRRANAIIMDSIYVVAFYTIEIPVSGGPESFTGLPGMILGVALPHDNVSWFATKVTDMSLPVKALDPPTKGKAVDNKKLISTLKEATKDWGQYANGMLKAFLL